MLRRARDRWLTSSGPPGAPACLQPADWPLRRPQIAYRPARSGAPAKFDWRLMKVFRSPLPAVADAQWRGRRAANSRKLKLGSLVRYLAACAPVRSERVALFF